MSTNTAMSSTPTRSQKLQNWFRRKDFFKPLRIICYVYLKCQAISILLSLGILNIGPNTPWLFWAFIQKLLQNFDGTTSLPVNGGLKNFSIEFGISKQWTQNTVPSSIFRGCLPNVIKRWKSSTESVRPFVANKYHNCSMANRQWICR